MFADSHKRCVNDNVYALILQNMHRKNFAVMLTMGNYKHGIWNNGISNFLL